MLSDKHAALAGKLDATQTALFTTGALTMKTVTPVSAGKANAAKPSARFAPGVAAARQTKPTTMSMLGASFKGSGAVSMGQQASLGGMQKAAESSSFFGSTADVVGSAGSSSYQYFANSGSTEAATPKTTMSMFAGSSSGASTKRADPTFMGALGHQVNMTRYGGSRRGTVSMMATATVSGEKVEAKEDHMDKVFLQQKYDNADHLDPVLHYTGNKFVEELMRNAKALSANGKGILASDESNGTCGKRFEAIGVENTEQNRNDYRELLYTTEGLEKYVSGAIMYDETIRQSAADGRTLVKVLADKGILTGIKVDTGIALIEGTNDETLTMGLDGLSQRAAEYYEMGARFAKWRAVLKITDDGCPSDVAITETAHSLARYAQICQHNGLVPIVEPEILTDGKHSIKTCARISEKVFNAVMNECITQNIVLEGMLLKPNMITSGAQAEVQAPPEEVAFFTVRTLARTIPPAVPGITFLSGGQSEEVACQNLDAINKLAEVKHPWSMTYSFGRALQSSVLTTWAGKKENWEAAQKRLAERCEASSAAAKGEYEGGAGSTESDYVANYVY